MLDFAGLPYLHRCKEQRRGGIDDGKIVAGGSRTSDTGPAEQCKGRRVGAIRRENEAVDDSARRRDRHSLASAMTDVLAMNRTEEKNTQRGRLWSMIQPPPRSWVIKPTARLQLSPKKTITRIIRPTEIPVGGTS